MVYGTTGPIGTTVPFLVVVAHNLDNENVLDHSMEEKHVLVIYQRHNHAVKTPALVSHPNSVFYTHFTPKFNQFSFDFLYFFQR